MRILLIEDNAALAARMKGLLSDVGFVVDHAADGEKGWHLGESLTYDAVLLDLGIPRIAGLDVLKSWRSSGRQVPVMILTGRTGWHERVVGFNAGADDYIEKPFEDEELIARLRSMLRRAHGKNSPIITHRDLALDSTCGLVRKNGEVVQLTALELRILTYLMGRPDRIFSQSELTDHVYSNDGARDSNTIEVYVARLRKKLGRNAIRTVRGIGYRMG